MIATIVLAAGLSSRMGANKLLLPLGEISVLESVIKTLKQCSLGPIILVTGRDFEATGAIGEKYDITVVHNPDFAQGQTTSIMVGLCQAEAIEKRLNKKFEGAMFVMGDQPLISVEGISLISDAFIHGKKRIIVPYNDITDKTGSPVVFDRIYFNALKALEGDTGGRQVIEAHLEAVMKVVISDSRFFWDVDSKESYEKVLKDRVQNEKAD